MIPIVGNTFLRSTDAISDVRPSIEMVSAQQNTPAVQRVRAARDRRVRYQQRSIKAKEIVFGQRDCTDQTTGLLVDIEV